MRNPIHTGTLTQISTWTRNQPKTGNGQGSHGLRGYHEGQKFMASIYLFDGIFDQAIWRWKPLMLRWDDETPGSVNLSHSDANAEAERDCEVLEYENSTKEHQASFQFPSEFYSTVLEFGQALFKATKGDPEDDKIVMEFSPAERDEEHGLGVVVSSSDGSLRAIFSKL